MLVQDGFAIGACDARWMVCEGIVIFVDCPGEGVSL